VTRAKDKIEATFNRPVKATLVVRTGNDEEWEATTEDLDKFQLARKSDMYLRIVQMFAEGLGLKHFDELSDHEGPNIIRYIIECGIYYDHTPWANAQGEPWPENEEDEVSYKDRLRATFTEDWSPAT